jgi:hypothetical protein
MNQSEIDAAAARLRQHFHNRSIGVSDNYDIGGALRLAKDATILADAYLALRERPTPPDCPRVGMTVVCPYGHEHIYGPSAHMDGRVYCRMGACRNDKNLWGRTCYEFRELKVKQ